MTRGRYGMHIHKFAIYTAIRHLIKAFDKLTLCLEGFKLHLKTCPFRNTGAY